MTGVQTCALPIFSDGSGWNKVPDVNLDSPQTLLLFFGSPDKSIVESQLQSLSKKFSRSIMLGCSSAGEIFDDAVYDNSISLSIIQFEDAQLELATEKISQSKDSQTAGERLANALNKDKLRSVLVLSDGLLVNGTKLIAGLSDNLPSDVVITGGLAGDGSDFNETWVWSGGSMNAAQICAVGFYGDSLNIGHGSRGGWDALGPERKVTKSTDNILYELDGQPALQLYKKYLGDRAEGLPATGLLFPLAITNENEDNDTVRTILAEIGRASCRERV